MALRTVGVRLTAEVSQYMANMKRAGGSTREFIGETKKAAEAGHLDRVADRAGAVGLGLAGMAAYAVKSAADFERSMSAVSAATHASTGEINQLRQAALQAGKDTQYSATGAADAITELSKAGVATSDILNGGLRGALSLAAAGQMEVGEAAETAASAMTQFRLSGDKVPHVADLLAAAAGKAQGSVHDMGYALKQSGLVAAQFGLSIEDTTGVLAEFASAGLIGSDAGTSLKTMLLALANPSKETRTLMADLGISFYDAQGKFIGLAGVAEVLRKRLASLTDEQRQQALGQLFGNDAIRAASIIYTDGAAGVEKWRAAVNDSGYAAETAAKLTDNLAGDIERLKGSLETLAIESGSGANGGVRILVQLLQSLVDKFGALPSVVSSTVTVLAGLSGAGLLLAAAWLKTRKTTAEFRAELEALGPAGERAASGMSKLTSAATKVSLIFAALEAAGAVIGQFQDDLNPQVEALAAGLEKYASGGKLAGEASRVLGDNLEDLKVGFEFLADEDNSRRQAVKHLQEGLESLVPGLDGTNTSLTKTKERITAMDAALAQLAQSGNTQQANEIFQKLAAELATGGVSLEEFRKQFPQYAAALEVAGKSTSGVAGATGDLNSALQKGADSQEKYATMADAAAGAARGEAAALTALASELKSQTDPVFGLLDAQKKLNDSQKSYTDAVKKHGKSSDEAKAALEDLTLAAIGMEDAAGTLAQTFDGRMDPALRATLKAAHVTDAQIDSIAGTFRQAKKDGDAFAKDYKAATSAPGATTADKQLKDAKKSADLYDGNYKAIVSTPGSTQAKTELNLMWNRLKDVDGNWVAHIRTEGYSGVASNLRHLLAAQRALKENTTVNEANRELSHFFATGGPVYGPGTGTSDSIPARLSAGEFVIKADSVGKLGTALLGYMNQNGSLPEGIADATPGFAAGGVVMPFPTDVTKTKIPKDVWSIPGGSGGPGYRWMEAVIRQAFPGLHVISDFRPGAMTLTGNRSYHGFGRAVDYPPSRPLAEWINAKYFSRTKELITPWNSLNIHNGQRHAYTGAVWNQHNFAGGNAHDHWAMARGGTITEPIFGVGASGRTYSFGENYQREQVVPNWQPASGGQGAGASTTVYITNTYAAGANLVEAGRHTADQLKAYLNAGGSVVLTNGSKVLP